jgi:hypothetical protein
MRKTNTSLKLSFNNDTEPHGGSVAAGLIRVVVAALRKVVVVVIADARLVAERESRTAMMACSR